MKTWTVRAALCPNTYPSSHQQSICEGLPGSISSLKHSLGALKPGREGMPTGATPTSRGRPERRISDPAMAKARANRSTAEPLNRSTAHDSRLAMRRSFLRRLRSPGSQRWQNSHCVPFRQPWQKVLCWGGFRGVLGGFWGGVRGGDFGGFGGFGGFGDFGGIA